MLKIKIFILLLSVVLLIVSFVFQDKKGAVVAYLRVKNEIKTIEACLESIDGIFDRIVIIHSNEKDDGSVAFMNKWCEKRNKEVGSIFSLFKQKDYFWHLKNPYCEIHEYPYAVIPSHHKKYRDKVPFENTLAAYNNFGLQFFDPEDWVVKIDADQVYIKDRLQEFLKLLKVVNSKKVFFCLKGYNTFPIKNHLYKHKYTPLNGVDKDSYVIKKSEIKDFGQWQYWEVLYRKNNQQVIMYPLPVWFHFKKSFNRGYEKIDEADLLKYHALELSEEEKNLFNKTIRPYLKNSPYYHLKLEKE